MPPVLHGVVRQTEGGKKGGHAKIKTWRRRPATNPSGSDDLLTKVYALVSWKYTRTVVAQRFRNECWLRWELGRFRAALKRFWSRDGCAG
jgi:hypothetical protein